MAENATEDELNERITFGGLLLKKGEARRASLEEQVVWLVKLMGSEEEARRLRPSLFDQLDAENRGIAIISEKLTELQEQLARLKR